MVSRRVFLATMVATVQQTRPTMSGPMDEATYRPISRPPKAGATPSMSADARDALEHRIHCQCGCTLDVYTCRTTDFTCPVSPQMHRDVMTLVAGGYTADEILATFVGAYGDKVLMAPPRQGFNWAGYLTPSIALLAGAVTLAVIIVRWRGGRAPQAPSESVPVGATSDELKRLEEAVRRDD
jgi:cytochrome c-type biogenesis protein CcmH